MLREPRRIRYHFLEIRMTLRVPKPASSFVVMMKSHANNGNPKTHKLWQQMISVIRRSSHV
jgi:hypothetical protein